METTRQITLDINSELYTKLEAKQNDVNSRFIEFCLTDRGAVLDLTGHTVKIFAVKPDNHIAFNNVSIEDAPNGKVLVELTSQVLAVAGDLMCELCIYGSDSSLLSTKVFTINVLKSIRDDSAVESANEFTALTNALSEISQLENKADKKYVDNTINSINVQLSNIDEQKANLSELQVERSRINNLVANAGDTSANSELIDTRVGADGITRLSSGESTRKQLKDIINYPTNYWTLGNKTVTNNQGVWNRATCDLTNLIVGETYEFYIESIIGALGSVLSDIYINDSNGNILSQGYQIRQLGQTVEFTVPTGTVKTTTYLFLNNEVAITEQKTAVFSGISIINKKSNSKLLHENVEVAYDNFSDSAIAKLSQQRRTLYTYFDNKWTLGNKSVVGATGATWVHTSGDLTNLVIGETYILYIEEIIGAIDGLLSDIYFYDSSNSVIYQGYETTQLGQAVEFTVPTGTVKTTFNFFLNTVTPLTQQSTAYFNGIHVIKKSDLVNFVINFDMSKYFDVILPPKIKLCKNKEINLYYDNFIYKSYFRDLLCRIEIITGLNNYSRQVAGIPSENDGTENFFEVYAETDRLDRIGTAFKYRIVDPAVKSNKSLNCMFVGDSFSEIGWYIDGIIEKATSDGISINTIGLMDTTNGKGVSENQTGGTLSGSFMSARPEKSYKVSVTGLTQKSFYIHYGNYATYSCNGYTWTVTGSKVDSNGNGYIRLTCSTNGATLNPTGTLIKLSGTGDATINYTSAESVNRNPFWNTDASTFDFQYYINKWGFNAPDVLVFMFGWNDYGAWADTSSFILNVQSFINKFHSQYPNARIIFSIPPFGYTGNAKRDTNGYKYSRLNCAKTLFKVFKDINYVDIVPSYAFVDTKNGFSTSTFKPCSRYDETIILGGDEIHNNESGMKQISDAVYPYLIDILS